MKTMKTPLRQMLAQLYHPHFIVATFFFHKSHTISILFCIFALLKNYRYAE